MVILDLNEIGALTGSKLFPLKNHLMLDSYLHVNERTLLSEVNTIDGLITPTVLSWEKYIKVYVINLLACSVIA